MLTLYYARDTCSLASHIVLEEVGARGSWAIIIQSPIRICSRLRNGSNPTALIPHGYRGLPGTDAA